MSQREFIFRPHVENRDRARARSLQKLFARHRLQAVALVEIAAHHALDLGHVALGDPAQRRQQFENGVVGQPVVDELSVAPVCHQAGAPHLLEMLRGVGDRQAGAIRQHLDAALALRQLLQQLEPMGMPERFRDGGKLGEQRQLRTARLTSIGSASYIHSSE